jgi:hypothetical protein
MSKMLTFRKTSYLWLLLASVGLVVTIYFTYQFFAVRNQLLDEAREYARQDTLAVSRELSGFIMMLKPVAESIAKELSSKKLSKAEIEALIREKKSPAIAGIGVAFLPHTFDQNTKLYAPYIFELDGEVKMMQLEKMYDYTKPEYQWFHHPLKTGPGFIEPYYGQASKTILVEYSVPFYYPDADGKRKPAGIVYANQNVEHLKHVLDTLFLGKTGYWFIITKKGVFLSHPQTQFADKQITIFELADRLKNPALAKAAEKITQQQEVFFEYDNEITGAPSWLFSEPIKGTMWSIVGVFDKSELDVKPKTLRRNLILPMLACMFFIIMLVVWFISLFNQSRPAGLWLASFAISLALMGAILWIWYATTLYPSYQREVTHQVENRLSLYDYLKQEITWQRYGVQVDQEEAIPKEVKGTTAKGEDESLFEKSKEVLHAGFYDARFIPTGIFINNIRFSSASQIEINAYVWQRFIQGVHDDIPRGLMFPQASERKIHEISRIRENDAEFMLWEVYARLNQFLEFEQYPFDTKAIHIQLWPRYSRKNIVLVPDLNAYRLINPRSLPGIDDDVYLPGWNLMATYFGYKMVNYTSNLGNYKVGPFGIYESIDKSGVPELYFDLLVTRHLLDTLVSDLLPIAVIAFLLFIILLTSVQQGYAVIGFCASVFFAVVVAHMRFREKIPRAQIVYFESFYFMMYVMIILVLLVTILYELEFDIPFIRYRKNIIAKLLYWPFLFGSLAVITMVYLY